MELGRRHGRLRRRRHGRGPARHRLRRGKDRPVGPAAGSGHVQRPDPVPSRAVAELHPRRRSVRRRCQHVLHQGPRWTLRRRGRGRGRGDRSRQPQSGRGRRGLGRTSGLRGGQPVGPVHVVPQRVGAGRVPRTPVEAAEHLAVRAGRLGRGPTGDRGSGAGALPRRDAAVPAALPANGHGGTDAPEMLFGLGERTAEELPVELSWRDSCGRRHSTTVRVSPGWHEIVLGADGSSEEER